MTARQAMPKAPTAMPASGAVRASESAQSGDEQERGEQICELEWCLYHDFTALAVPSPYCPAGTVLVRLNIDNSDR